MPLSSKPVKPWHFIPFWPFVLVAALGLLWWQRIAIVGWLVGFAPLSGDWQITHLELDDITLDQVRIAQLDLVQGETDHGDAEPMKLAMENVSVDYQLFTGNGVSVKSVDIGQARLGMSGSESESSATLGSLLQEVRALLQRPMPEIRLNADQLLIENPLQQARTDQLAVSLQSTGDYATATLRYGDQQAVLRIGAELESAPTGRQFPPQQIAALSLIATESGIRLDAGLDLEKLYPIATEFGILPAVHSDDYNLSGPVQLNLDLIRSGDDVIADFTIQPLDIVSGHTTISGIQGKGRVAIPASQKPVLPLTLHVTDGLEITAKRGSDNENRIDDPGLELYGTLTLSRDNFDIMLTDRSRFEGAAAVSLADSAIQISQFSLIPALSATAGKITLQPGFSIQADTLAMDELEMNNLIVTPLQPVTLPTGLHSLADKPLGDWRVHAGIRLSDVVALNTRLHVNIIDPAPDHLNLAFIAEQLQFSMPRHFPEVDSAKMTLTSEGSALSGQGRIDLAPLQNSLDITLDHDSGQDKTRATVASAGEEPVQSLLAMLNDSPLQIPLELAVSQGSADFMAEAIWTGSNNGTNSNFNLDLAGNDISGRIDDVAFQGLELDIKAALTPTGKLNGDVHTTLDAIDYGLTVRDINSEFRFASTATGPLPALDVQTVSGTLFDSRFYSDPFNLDLNNPQARFAVRVNSLDIEKLVETQGIDHLSATGRVSGVFPVTVDNQGVTIVNGTVTNLPGGGRIQYDISDQQAQALDNPLTDIVITALRDFRYDVLTADTNYNPDGELFIDFHLEGISPQLDPDRQVNLNITTRQNVLSLLSSLNYSDGLNQTIDQQIQDNMK